jgi:hypothetical protein
MRFWPMFEEGALGYQGMMGLHCGGGLVERAHCWCGRIAQLVEQLTLNQRAQGSSPCAPTNDFNHINRLETGGGNDP